jgi:hypothetical protein
MEGKEILWFIDAFSYHPNKVGASIGKMILSADRLVLDTTNNLLFLSIKLEKSTLYARCTDRLLVHKRWLSEISLGNCNTFYFTFEIEYQM